jgi:hypothetical protein
MGFQRQRQEEFEREAEVKARTERLWKRSTWRNTGSGPGRTNASTGLLRRATRAANRSS